MKIRRLIAGALMVGALVAVPFVVQAGDPDLPGATEDNNYLERCFYIGDLASCVQAFWDWWMDQSLI